MISSDVIVPYLVIGLNVSYRTVSAWYASDVSTSRCL